METIEKEKALDVVRQMVADGQVSQEVAEKYFPELKESNGERIRQLLIRFVKYDMSDNYSDDFRKEDCLDWLKSIKDRVQPQPKQEWNEKNKKLINRIEGWLDTLCDYLKDSSPECIEDVKNIVEQLKSIRPQNGYNPYKEIVESIAEMCKHYDKASHSGLRDFYDNVKVKCKDAKEYESLFPQSTWKPSDEQMKALDFYIKTYVDTEGCYGSEVLELYEQLKKLREE